MDTSNKGTNFNLEAKLKRLEQIASSIQNPNIGIDEALKLYKEGIELSKQCKEIILNIETEVQELSKNDIKDKATNNNR